MFTLGNGLGTGEGAGEVSVDEGTPYPRLMEGEGRGGSGELGLAKGAKGA